MLKLLKKHIRLISLVLIVALSIIIFIFRESLSNLQGFGIAGLFALSILGNATIILPTPVVLTAFIGGAVFNPLLVASVVATGATIGELTGYIAGYGSAEIVNNDAKLQKIKNWMSKYGLWTIFVLAVIPNPLFDLAGIAAGTIGIPLKKYFLVVWLGKFIKFGVFAYLGSRSIILLDKFI